jgi:DNA-binding Lrp family transcriptional regulator
MGEMPDELDSRLLLELQRNARISFKEIASEVKTSVAAAINRVKALEEKGKIRGYSALVDPKKLGYETAILELVVSRGSARFNGLPSLRCHQRDRHHSCLYANSRLEANLARAHVVLTAVKEDLRLLEEASSPAF